MTSPEAPSDTVTDTTVPQDGQVPNDKHRQSNIADSVVDSVGL